MSTSITSNNYFAKQKVLLGELDHQAVRAAKVLIVGMGGLGCPVATNLATSGVGYIGIVDGDQVDISNLQRQFLYNSEDIGLSKVHVAFSRLQQMAPFSQIEKYDSYLNNENAQNLISKYDLVIDCTDNFKTKFLIHDVCFNLRKKLVIASVYQIEGQVQVFDFAKSGPCFRCLWDVEPTDGCTGTCADVGVFSPLVGVIGSYQAMEALKLITNRSPLTNGKSLMINLMSHSTVEIGWEKQSSCQCHTGKIIPMMDGPQVIDARESFHSYKIIDVREILEHNSCHIIKKMKVVNLPLDQINMESLKNLDFNENDKILVICKRGQRSLKALENLNLLGFKNVFSQVRGVDGLISDAK